MDRKKHVGRHTARPADDVTDHPSKVNTIR
jgi:hypothetical protein